MPTPWHYADDRIRIRKLCVGRFENNVFVVAAASTDDAVIIDAADEADRIVAECADVRPSAILTTHGHWDHVQAAREVSRRLSIPFRLHEADAEVARFDPDVPIEPDEEIPIGTAIVRALHTPGHTPGSTCFSLDGHLFSGDTLFPGGPGSTAGTGASFRDIMSSLRKAVFTLPDATLVYPGHGLDTVIGFERPQLGTWEARGW